MNDINTFIDSCSLCGAPLGKLVFGFSVVCKKCLEESKKENKKKRGKK